MKKAGSSIYWSSSGFRIDLHVKCHPQTYNPLWLVTPHQCYRPPPKFMYMHSKTQHCQVFHCWKQFSLRISDVLKPFNELTITGLLNNSMYVLLNQSKSHLESLQHTSGCFRVPFICQSFCCDSRAKMSNWDWSTGANQKFSSFLNGHEVDAQNVFPFISLDLTSVRG